MSDEDVFWGRVQRGPGCWEWQGTRRPDGYGVLLTRWHRQERAHRVAYELTYGPIPEGKFVCHRCDNPPCVRPDHLFVGTQADNLADMDAKGRRYHFTGRPQAGSLNHASKLTEDDVRAIRALAGTMRHEDIAAQFGVTRPSVSYILEGKTWTHVK